MTPNELIDIIRSEYLDEFLDDASSSVVRESAVKNKTPFLLREIGTAQRRACWRGDMRRIFDDSTAAICTLTLVAETQSYALDSRVLLISAALYDSALLNHTTLAMLDARRNGWREYADGAPSNFYIQGRTLYLDRAPSTAEAGEEISLSVWREPLASPELGTELEVDLDPEALANWVAYRAFLRPNQDKSRADLAKHHLDAFDSYYGQEISKPARDDMLANPPFVSFGPMTPPRRNGYRRTSFEYLNGE